MGETVKGYKAFEKGLVGFNDFQYEIGGTYHLEGEVKRLGNGFWFCENIEDTFRYLSKSGNEMEICSVIGSGEVKKFTDDYYGYDIVGCTDIYIERLIPRNEIYGMFLEELCKPYKNLIKVERFVRDYEWTEEEIEEIKSYLTESEINRFQYITPLSEKHLIKEKL